MARILAHHGLPLSLGNFSFANLKSVSDANLMYRLFILKENVEPMLKLPGAMRTLSGSRLSVRGLSSIGSVGSAGPCQGCDQKGRQQ